jgi:hypothetical protein
VVPVMMRVDPRKASHTTAAIYATQEPLSELCIRACLRRRSRAAAGTGAGTVGADLGSGGATDMGNLLVQQLRHAGEGAGHAPFGAGGQWAAREGRLLLGRFQPCDTVVRYCHFVPDEVTVQVPGEFAAELVSAGFRRVRRLRGGGVEPVLTFLATSGGLAADAATILLAKDAIADFIARLRSWMAGRGRSQAGHEFVIEVSRRSPGADSRLRLVTRWDSGDAGPEADMQALTSLLDSVFTGQRALGQHKPGAAPHS